jgi:uncharacterized protein with PhoU and TrkA domain
MKKNVRELISDMKNISQLMLDLAYSAIFLENKSLAKEVLELRKKLEKTEDEILSILFHLSRTGISTEERVTLTDIVDCFKDVGSAAAGLAHIVLTSKGFHPVVKKAIEESEEKIIKQKISPRSIVANKTMGETKLRTKTGVDIVTIRRGDEWIINPDKSTKILANDIVIGIGTETSCELFKKIASGKVKKF